MPDDISINNTVRMAEGSKVPDSRQLAREKRGGRSGLL
jgi:hypothetical protein